MTGSSPIVVVGAGGGVGATMLAGGIALARVRTGILTQLVELDLEQGDIAGAWSAPADRTIGDLVPVAVAREVSPTHLRAARHAHESGVALLLAPGRPGSSVPWDDDATRGLLDAAAADGEVVVDGGSRLLGPAASACAYAPVVLLVAPASLSGARRALRMREALVERCPGREPRLVVNLGSGLPELGASALGIATGMEVAAILPRSDREAGELSAGRWPRSRRGGLSMAVAGLAEAF